MNLFSPSDDNGQNDFGGSTHADPKFLKVVFSKNYEGLEFEGGGSCTMKFVSKDVKSFSFPSPNLRAMPKAPFTQDA